jgi:YD repeat-containing protein
VANDLFDDVNNQVVQDEWTYDLLGNFQTKKVGGVGQQWDTAVRFSEPAFIDDGGGNPLELLTWDGQGRLTDRTTASDQYRYAYDGAGRLDSAEVNGGSHHYGYNVDDELIFEDHKSYRVYRFGSYRYASNDKRIIVKPVPQIALITQSGKTTSRWMFLEPDGHALESAGDVLGQAGELSFDILGAYGRTLASSGDVLPIDGFHGADADPGVGVVPFGVRHVVKDVGIWMQPEPLLYLGLTNGLTESPRAYSGVYAGANPVEFGDRSGYFPTKPTERDWANVDADELGVVLWSPGASQQTLSPPQATSATPVASSGPTWGDAAVDLLAAGFGALSGDSNSYGQLIAHDSEGHAMDHADDGDFGPIDDADDLGDYLDGIIMNPSDEKSDLARGRKAWLGEDGTVVIYNPEGPSTALNPDSQGDSSQDYWETIK